jgi:hypothetical protein
MGCCNKKHDGNPISVIRYYAGLVVLGSAQMGAMGLLFGLSVPFPRYRKVIPFAKAFMVDTMRSALERDRIVVDGMESTEDEFCEWEPGMNAALEWSPPESDLASMG